MGLVSMIVNYRRLEDAIYFIETNQSKLRISELNEALNWAGKNPREFKGKDRKIEELLNYLKNGYMK
jgi:hypothetical protein